MRLVLLFLIMYISTTIAWCQKPAVDESVFDVVFWKKELRLSRVQLLQLYLINRDVYNALWVLAEQDCIESSDLALLMQLWKTETIGVLTDKQIRRWEKIKMRYKKVTRHSRNGQNVTKSTVGRGDLPFAKRDPVPSLPLFCRHNQPFGVL